PLRPSLFPYTTLFRSEAIPMLHERPGLEGFRFELGPWASPDRVVLVFRPEGLPQGRVTAEETRAIVQALSEQPEFEAVELNYIRDRKSTRLNSSHVKI